MLVTVAAAATRSVVGSEGADSALTATVHGDSVAFVVASGLAFAAFLVALAAIRTPDGPPASA